LGIWLVSAGEGRLSTSVPKIPDKVRQPEVAVVLTFRDKLCALRRLDNFLAGRSAAPTNFVSVEVTDNPPARPQTLDEPPGPATPAIIIERPVSGIEIELMGGRRVRFDRDIDAETMRRVVSALEEGGP